MVIPDDVNLLNPVNPGESPFDEAWGRFMERQRLLIDGVPDRTVKEIYRHGYAACERWWTRKMIALQTRARRDARRRAERGGK
jgi:hypothetical protein